MISRFILAVSLVVLLTGCATTRPSPDEVAPMHSVSEFKDQPFVYVSDPWEPFNRNMYRFNYYFDRFVYLPVVSGYEFVTPVFVQKRISHFFDNITEIRNFSNSLFQLKGKEAVTTLGRFLTNSTLGLGGLFDPATEWGLAKHPEDFGRTLGYWGVGSGPYLVLPVWGPSSARDTGGLAVDGGIRYVIFSNAIPNSDDRFTITTSVEALEAIDARHQQPFRYYEGGYPFDYELVRFVYHEMRELESSKPLAK